VAEADEVLDAEVLQQLLGGSGLSAMLSFVEVCKYIANAGGRGR
jgi:hypothetical protein